MKKRTTSFAALAMMSIAGVAFAGDFKKHAGNPVLGNKELGTCFDVNVVTNGPAPYTMYFSWRPKAAIALVRSDDGFRWTQTPEICLEADKTSGWEDVINRSCTVRKDGVWHMWYTGQILTGPNRASRIGYATSTDGVHFTRVRKEPVLVPEFKYETPSTMNPYVRWDEARKVWRMWYAAGEQYEPNVLCYAESADGIRWKKWAGNPFFGRGDIKDWDRDRVGACEVHPLPDGRWAMFYIGYSDIHTARIGCAISADGLTDWKRLPQNPLVSPDPGTWDASACYKPSVVRDEKNKRWLLWYNGRNGRPEYVGMAIREGLDLEANPSPFNSQTSAPNHQLPTSQPPTLNLATSQLLNLSTSQLLSSYVRRFNAADTENKTNAVPNAAAEAFLLKNAPRFACPDRDIERTYYFRWWTYRKHLRRDLGLWTVSEFLPNVGWAGAGNTIVCAAGHHIREGRWLRDDAIIADCAKFWLADKRATHRWRYSSWLYTATRLYADVTGREDVPAALLDDAVKYYERWEQGFRRGKLPMGGDGKGGFLSIDNYEGTEISLGGNGYKPLLASAMWSEAKSIAAVARKLGRSDLADTFEKKAEANRQAIFAHCWNPKMKFFVTTPQNGPAGTVRELHGYAPWYFGMPADGRAPDWAQLADPQGFAARYGLTFPERRAKGFKLDYRGHDCKWNGPSWPFATSVALTAYVNDLHAHASASDLQPSTSNLFPALLHQYAAQHRLALGDDRPWIDENLNPDQFDWIARRILNARSETVTSMRGKDYNHSTFCDLVISGLVGFLPNGDGAFTVAPLCPAEWHYLTLENLRYRGHDVSIRWRQGEGLSVSVDGKRVARRNTLGKLDVKF